MLSLLCSYCSDFYGSVLWNMDNWLADRDCVKSKAISELLCIKHYAWLQSYVQSTASLFSGHDVYIILQAEMRAIAQSHLLLLAALLGHYKAAVDGNGDGKTLPPWSVIVNGLEIELVIISSIVLGHLSLRNDAHK